LTPMPTEMAHTLWQTCERRGGYTRLETRAREALRALGRVPPDEESACFEEEAPESGPGFPSPPREIANVYDVIEVAGGSGVVSQELRRRGRISLVIDLSRSEHFDLQDDVVLRWIFFLVQHQRVGAVLLEPPCTDFSSAKHPASRSYAQPRGFWPRARETLAATRLALRCLAIFFMVEKSGVVGLFEQPKLSKMACLPEWKLFLNKSSVLELFTESCAFWRASVDEPPLHKKSLRFLICHMLNSEIDLVCRCCPRDHTHEVIEGSATRKTSVYNVGLTEALADAVVAALGRREDLVVARSSKKGSERLVANELLLAAPPGRRQTMALERTGTYYAPRVQGGNKLGARVGRRRWRSSCGRHRGFEVLIGLGLKRPLACSGHQALLAAHEPVNPCGRIAISDDVWTDSLQRGRRSHQIRRGQSADSPRAAMDAAS
jgi:hypothetical protein